MNELKLADLEILENKFNFLQKKSKSGDKDIAIQLDIIKELQNKIDDESTTNFEFSKKSKDLYNSLNLISSKPMLYICNVDEDSIISGNIFSHQVKNRVNKESNNIVLVCAAIESQITKLDEKDKLEIIKELGLKDTTLKKVIKAGYKLLDLITFFTFNSKETRAWAIEKNTKASKAAGKIHSDFEKGFIRAETISYKNFVELNGETACREAGKLTQEGQRLYS